MTVFSQLMTSLRAKMMADALSLEASGVSRREIEERLGLGHGWCSRNLPPSLGLVRPGRKKRDIPVPSWVPEPYREEYRRRCLTTSEPSVAMFIRRKIAAEARAQA